MHQRPLAEHVLDGSAQGLPAVNDEQDRLLGIQAPLDQVREQRASERGVLGRALPQPQRNLHPVGGDPQRDHVRAISECCDDRANPSFAYQ
jgi:hypothetical protein